ncbi:hypothetical protein LMH73_023645 [Vibrio splendidus]|nr:hypothetical protein [Vibrio splendidus]MCC4882980.1 hypothetical protein [Vibrio splendidus]
MSKNPALMSIKDIASEVFSMTTSGGFSSEMMESYRGSVDNAVESITKIQDQYFDEGNHIGALMSEVRIAGLNASVSLVASTQNISTGQIDVNQQANMFMNNIQNSLSKLTFASKMDGQERTERKQFMGDAQCFYDQKTPENMKAIGNAIDQAIKDVMIDHSLYGVTEGLQNCIDEYGKEFVGAVYTPRVREGLADYKAPQQDNDRQKGMGLDGYSNADMERIKREFNGYAKDQKWSSLEW